MQSTMCQHSIVLSLPEGKGETTHLQSALSPFSTVVSSSGRLLAPPREEMACSMASLSPCLPTSVMNISRSICMEHAHVVVHLGVRPCSHGYTYSKVPGAASHERRPDAGSGKWSSPLRNKIFVKFVSLPSVQMRTTQVRH